MEYIERTLKTYLEEYRNIKLEDIVLIKNTSFIFPYRGIVKEIRHYDSGGSDAVYMSIQLEGYDYVVAFSPAELEVMFTQGKIWDIKT